MAVSWEAVKEARRRYEEEAKDKTDACSMVGLGDGHPRAYDLDIPSPFNPEELLGFLEQTNSVPFSHAKARGNSAEEEDDDSSMHAFGIVPPIAYYPVGPVPFSTAQEALEKAEKEARETKLRAMDAERLAGEAGDAAKVARTTSDNLALASNTVEKAAKESAKRGSNAMEAAAVSVRKAALEARRAAEKAEDIAAKAKNNAEALNKIARTARGKLEKARKLELQEREA